MSHTHDERWVKQQVYIQMRKLLRARDRLGYGELQIQVLLKNGRLQLFFFAEETIAIQVKQAIYISSLIFRFQVKKNCIENQIYLKLIQIHLTIMFQPFLCRRSRSKAQFSNCYFELEHFPKATNIRKINKLKKKLSISVISAETFFHE